MSSSLEEADNWEFITRPEIPEDQLSYNGNWYFRLLINSRCIYEVGPTTTTIQRKSQVLGPEFAPQRSSQEQSPFFKLPAEIRMQIYETVLQVRDADSAVELEQRSNPRSVLNLLLTCHRVLDEAECIFYSINRLRINDPQFWKVIGPRRRNAIIMYSMLVRSGADMLSSLQDLHQAPRLQSLLVERQTSIRYTDVRQWRYMLNQLVAEIEKMPLLEEIKIWTPQLPNPNLHELKSRQQLCEVDDRICGAVRPRSNA